MIRVAFCGILGCVVLAHCGASAAAQTDACLDRLIPVTVLTNDHNPVPGLATANFKAKLEGKPLQVLSASYDPGPHRVVIGLDVSGSMQEQGRIPFELRLAEMLIDASQASDSFAVVAFGQRVEETIPFGLDRQMLLATIQKFRQRGWAPSKTAVLDALAAALDLLKPSRPGDSIYLITDGIDNSSRLGSKELLNLVLGNVRLFSVLPVPESHGRVLSEQGLRAGPEFIDGLSLDTGGLSVPYRIDPRRPAEPPTDKLHFSVLPANEQYTLVLATRYVAAHIDAVYQVQVRLPDRLDKPQRWKLDLVNSPNLQTKDFRLAYPKCLAACEP